MVEDEIKLETNKNTNNDQLEELTLDNLTTGYIKNPKVGEEIEFTIEKMYKNDKDTTGVDPTNKRTFSTALSKVDYKVEIHTTDGKIYTVSSWEVWGKLKSGLRQLRVIKGVQVNIKHIENGLLTENKGKSCYIVKVRYGNTSWIEINKPEVATK